MERGIQRPLIALATYRRPEWLSATLSSLRDSVGPDLSRHIIIVDNDAAGSGRETVERHGLAGQYVVEPEPGIAAARNRALQEFDHRYDSLIFVDDDEVVEPQWFATLMGYANSSGADVVQGAVISDLSEGPAWIANGGYIQLEIPPTGTVLPYAATNNTLVRRSIWEAAGSPRFDPAFSETGGSDTKFFTLLKDAGADIRSCAEARVIETTPAKRLNAKWIVQREYRNGIVLGRLRTEAGVSMRWALRTAVAGTVRGAQWVVAFVLRRPSQGQFARRALINAGQLGALLGHRVREYRRPTPGGARVSTA